MAAELDFIESRGSSSLILIIRWTPRTDSPYRTTISQAILHLQEDGTIQNLTRKWWETENTDDEGNQVDCNAGLKEASDTPELDMDNVGGVFLVLCVGLAVAIVIGLLEFLWSVRRVAIDEKVTQSLVLSVISISHEIFIHVFFYSIGTDHAMRSIRKRVFVRDKSVENAKTDRTVAQRTLVARIRLIGRREAGHVSIEFRTECTECSARNASFEFHTERPKCNQYQTKRNQLALGFVFSCILFADTT